MDKYIEIIENDPVIKLIKPYLNDVKAYIVGGFIRDVLMGKKSPDRDLIVCINDVKELVKVLNKLESEFKIYYTKKNKYMLSMATGKKYRIEVIDGQYYFEPCDIGYDKVNIKEAKKICDIYNSIKEN